MSSTPGAPEALLLGAKAPDDSILTSAILDRLLHHAETVIIEGKSFRMKDKLEQ